MTALDCILKMIELIRMFGVAPAHPTKRDDLVSYVAALRRQLCTLANKHGTRATRNALALTNLTIKMLGLTAAAEPLAPSILRLLQSPIASKPLCSDDGENCRTHRG